MNRAEEIFRDIKAKKQRNLLLKVQAGAKQNSIDGLITINQKKYVKFLIKAEPTDGKANKMMIEFLSKKLGLSKSIIEIKTGKTNSCKVLRFSI